MTAIRTFFQEFWNRIPQIGVNDIIDILIVAFLFYTVMRLIRSTSAARIARSILLLLVVTGLTEIFKLYTLNWILSKILEIGVIALVIMFQPELRRMLERFGGRFFTNLISSGGAASPEQQAIEATVAACEVMSKEKVGALLIFERSMPLDEYFKTGTIVDAKVSDQLLRNLFFKNSPLHDGAVIVRGSRVAAAGCVMPLTENTHLPSDIGRGGRHRLRGDGDNFRCHRRHAQAAPGAEDARKAPGERTDFGAGAEKQHAEDLALRPFQNEAGTK